ncbi:AraC family transcriptional regulator [Pseudomaricurvus alkylphenolicus]|uniref:AraC family transcriptional regulator n=1 Tax=Pseudomaricurvus alkylphenolicus TaxID=1306991 RepID=UPI001421566F|nr:AraC family transcriptional regulator [Pseudomaricurvus alkylphenolicus]NIB43436.1 AraC family transcriptional regulator [Pseudomaricurvus alkylphenolicus]
MTDLFNSDHIDTALTASTTSFRLMHEALWDFQINPYDVYQDAGLGSDFLDDPERRVSIEAFRAYWAAIESRSQNPNIGLLLAEHAHISPINAPMMLLQASNTFGEGLQRFIRFRQIMDPLYESTLVQEGDTAIFCFDLQHTMFRQRMECLCVFFCRFFQMATDDLWQPRRICFQHPAPDSLQEHERILRCPIEFNRDHYSIYFDAGLLQHTLFTRSPGFCAYNEKFAATLLENVATTGLVASVRRTLASILEFGDISLDKVAEVLNQEPNVLQARLRDIGCPFNEVLDSVRKEIATRMVIDTNDSFQDIAYVTGYSALPNFYRAFKRWHGMTPVAYRQEASGQHC